MKTVPAYLLGAIAFLVTASPATETWNRHTIDPSDPDAGKKGADGVRIGDINGDGLPDIVTGWEEGDAIRVCLNPGPESSREIWPAITAGRAPHTEDAVFGDLNGDGRPDVISSSEGSTRTVFIHWAPGTDDDLADEALWETAAFPATEKQQRWMFCLPYDVDHDGDTDLFLGSKNENGSISWLENPGNTIARDVEKWNLHRITDAAWIMTLKVLQSAGNDYLLASDRKGSNSGIYLIQLLNEPPFFGKARLIAASGEEVMFLDVARLDDDDHLDIVASIKPNQTRIFYQPVSILAPWVDSSELDPFSQDLYGTAKAVKVGDLSGDNIPDFVITCEKANGTKHGAFISNVFSEITEVSGPEGVKFDRIELLDLDADGDLDIITCEESHHLGVFWYENPLK